MSVMMGTLLYVFGSRERHSELTEEMSIPLRPIPKEDSLDVHVSINWATNRPWQTKVFDTWKVTQLNILRQKSVKASTSRAEDPGFESRLCRDFSGSSHTSDLDIGTPVATPSGAWRYRVSVRAGWPGVSIVWLGEMENFICNFYLSVAARTLVWADPSLRYTRKLLGR